MVTAESVGKVNLDGQATGVPLGWMWQTNGASGKQRVNVWVHGSKSPLRIIKCKDTIISRVRVSGHWTVSVNFCHLQRGR